MLFEKTMESLPKRMDLELVTNATRAKKLIARPTTLHWYIATETKNNHRSTDLSRVLYIWIVKK